jgi:hypothetical protein
MNHNQECIPRVSPNSKSQVFGGRGHRLMSVHWGIPFALAELRKAEAVEFIWVRIDSFICVNSTGRNGDEGARGNSHAI